jgi:class 3 adenylate cyclase
MPPSTCQALLLIADIGGFTQFMKLHRMSVNHAKQVIVELLKAIISASSSPLKLAEIEGDAAFFYAVCPEDSAKLPDVLAQLKAQMLAMFRAFYQVKQNLNSLRLCVCDACKGANNLRLKIIVHSGEVAFERIQAFEKLFGLDVILVHRLLKNHLSAREYILMTEPVLRQLGGFYALQPEKCKVNCEGIGKVEAHVFYPPAELIGVADNRSENAPPSFLRKLRWAAQLDGNFFLDLLRPQKQKASV